MSGARGSRGRGGFRRRPYHVGFGLLAVVVTAVLFGFLYLATTWHPYLIWILALSAITFGLMVLDKLLAKSGDTRIPEVIFHIFTLLGGFLGQFVGRIVAKHKTNLSRHPAFFIVFVVSAIIHGLLAYYWFFS
jgi:uncharacterized membrane protein YsdA (DUF1294 family)